LPFDRLPFLRTEAIRRFAEILPAPRRALGAAFDIRFFDFPPVARFDRLATVRVARRLARLIGRLADATRGLCGCV
jgi:hypothetical protein